MKTSIVLLLFLGTLSAFCVTHIFKENDTLKKLSWIEGNWKGMDGDKPFYELYRMVNDTTLEIFSYSWNGKDSSESSRSVVGRKNGTYYLGDSLNYKVVALTDSSIFMIPNYKAFNSILWKRVDANKWEAILQAKRGRKVYIMERINHFANSNR